MAIPLTVAIVLLVALVAASGVVIWRLLKQMQDASRATVEQMQQMINQITANQEQSLKMALKLANDAPKSIEKVADSLGGAVDRVSKSLADGMRAVYAPITPTQTPTDGALGDVITPWYGGVGGGMDFTDPTDAIQGVRADGAEYAGSVIEHDDAEPFGIPGLGIDPAIGGTPVVVSGAPT